MNNTVYVVTRGDYSDYQIMGVTMDKERAEKMAKMYSSSMYEATVEEYVLDETVDKILYGVKFDSKGEVKGVIRTEWRDTEGVEVSIYENTTIFWVLTKDENLAVKIAQDRRAECLARKEGIS